MGEEARLDDMLAFTGARALIMRVLMLAELQDMLTETRCTDRP